MPGSSIVWTQSTNGTSATTARHRPGAREYTAPCSSPPADRPRAEIRLPSTSAREPGASPASQLATAMKSSNVFGFARSLPCSHQFRPHSPPPRTCAIAYTMPRSSIDGRLTSKAGNSQDS